MKSLGRTRGYFRENNFKGGIHIVDSMHAVEEVASKMCGKHLVIPGKNENGLICNSVLVSEYIDYKHAYFIQISYSRKHMMPMITYSEKGGLSYEQLQKQYPETIKNILIDVKKGLDLNRLG